MPRNHRRGPLQFHVHVPGTVRGRLGIPEDGRRSVVQRLQNVVIDFVVSRRDGNHRDAVVVWNRLHGIVVADLHLVVLLQLLHFWLVCQRGRGQLARRIRGGPQELHEGGGTILAQYVVVLVALVNAIHDRLRSIDLVHRNKAAGPDLREAVIIAIIIGYVLEGRT